MMEHITIKLPRPVYPNKQVRIYVVFALMNEYAGILSDSGGLWGIC